MILDFMFVTVLCVMCVLGTWRVCTGFWTRKLLRALQTRESAPVARLSAEQAAYLMAFIRPDRCGRGHDV